MASDTPRYFRPVCPADCKHPNDRHIHRGQFEAYWRSLTEREKQSLRDKAEWEHMSLAAVAMDWGAINGGE